MRITTLPNSFFFFGVLSLAQAACFAPWIANPHNTDYAQTPTGFLFEAYTIPGCNIFTITYIDTTSDARKELEYTSGYDDEYIRQVINAPPGEYTLVSTVRGDPNQVGVEISPSTTSETFHVLPLPCRTPSLLSPVSGGSYRTDPPGFPASIGNLECSRVEVFYRMVGGIEQSAIIDQAPGGNPNVAEQIPAEVGEYDVSVQSFDTVVNRPISARSDPVRITVLAGKCSPPTIIEPLDGQTFHNNPSGFSAQLSSSDCRSVNLYVKARDGTGLSYIQILSVPNGEATIYTDLYVQFGRYSLSAIAYDTDRVESVPSQTRNIVVGDPKCQIPSLDSPSNGDTSTHSPTGFTYDISTTDCNTLVIYAEQIGVNYKYQQSTTLAAGQSSLSLFAQVPTGSYNIYVQAFGPNRIASDRSAGIVLVVAREKCPVPTINHPSGGERFQTLGGATEANVRYDIMTSYPCTSVSILTTDPDGTITTKLVVGSTSYSESARSAPGTYAVSAVARDPSTALADSDPVPKQTFYVDPSACDSPILTVTPHNQQPSESDGSFTYKATYANCRRISLYLGGNLVATRDAAVGSTTFTETIRVAPGEYRAQLKAEDIPSSADSPVRPSSSGNFRNVNIYVDVACTAPVITSPLGTATNPAVTGRRPTVIGTTTSQSLCTIVALFTLDAGGTEQFIGYAQRADDNTFSIQVTDQMSLGTHVIYAAAAASGSNIDGLNSNQVTIFVGADMPGPTVNLGTATRRRRVQCKRDEDTCPHVDIRGRKLFVCVPDLDSNLEQCGSCGGPDCTLLPNVDDVACVNGQCLVTTCLEGFFLKQNACGGVSDAQNLMGRLSGGEERMR